MKNIESRLKTIGSTEYDGTWALLLSSQDKVGRLAIIDENRLVM